MEIKIDSQNKIKKLEVRLEANLPSDLKELRQIIRRRANALALESEIA